ncbi:MAG: hypothetical protein SVW77_01920 [Candidatus Nanohaloarchaea archaeon]|nr:hypothetical protein [Candidatus Nanohaloarchaea archaeon]
MQDVELFDALFWLSLLIAAALAIWALLGDSPTTDQIIIALIIPALLGIFHLREKHGERTTEIIQRLESIDSTLQRIEEDDT